MIINPKKIEEFENKFERENPKSFLEKIAIYEDMLKTVNLLNKRTDLLAGLDEKIEIIKRLHLAKRNI